MLLSRHDSDEIRYLEREAYEAERNAWTEADGPEDGFPLDPAAAEPAAVGRLDGDYPF
jgi:hypothetical protein